MGETCPTERNVGDPVKDDVWEVEDVSQLGLMVHQMQEELMEQQQAGDMEEE